MASHPPGKCCFEHVLAEGTPRGKMTKIEEIDVYIASPPEPESSTKAIIYAVDAVGIYTNAQLLADQFASHGYHVLMPDIMQGDALRLNHQGQPVDLDIWLKKWIQPASVTISEGIVERTIQYAREEMKMEKLCAVGYCYGGKFAVRSLKKGQVDVGFVAHPSFVTIEEVLAIESPLSIAAAEVDGIFTPELRHKSEELLVETKQPWQINLYSGVQHGFAVKGPLNDKLEKFARDAAFNQALTWFDLWAAE